MSTTLSPQSAWVDAWVRSHADLYMTMPPAGGVPREGPRVHLGGSLCVDALLYPDGSVLLSEYEMLDTGWSPCSFREATDKERIFWLVAASSRYPELRRMLPERPEGAPDCERCEGACFWSRGYPCEACSGLGWQQPSTAPRE